MIKLDSVLSRFTPISLEEMDNVALQARMDTKYLFSEARLPELLRTLSREYRLLEVNGQRGTTYRTLYFDTADYQHYFDHHKGRPRRNKVRMREYLSSGACFLEVKRKTGRGGTDKQRLPAAGITETLSPAQIDFIARNSGNGKPLGPVLWNAFFRYTLVHNTRAERLTIDRSLTFHDTNGKAALPGVCVAELKEFRSGHGSPFAALMRALPVPPVSFSKYCIGTLLLRPRTKHNMFKPVMLQAARLAKAA